jgi:hypothetical protein
MATFTANFAELLEPRLRRVYFNQYRMQPKLYAQVANVITSTRAHEDTIKVSGLSTLRAKGEGAPVPYDDPIQGTRKRVIHVTYALGFRVTMEMSMDDLYNVISRMPRDLADATIDHQENLFWGIFNDSFAGNTHTGLDALSLVNTAHPNLKAGGNQSNQLAPAVALSVTGLEALLTRAKLMQSESGRFTPVTPSVLVIHPNNDHEAHRLLESEFEPGTSDNQVNTMRSSRTGVRPLSVPYISLTDAYWLIARKEQHSLLWYNRMGTTFSRGKDSQTKDGLYDVMYRASVTFDDWRGVWGSNP